MEKNPRENSLINFSIFIYLYIYIPLHRIDGICQNIKHKLTWTNNEKYV